jgi:hypothetical protein
MPARVAQLGQITNGTRESITSLRSEMREMRSEMRDIRAEMRQGRSELRREARADFNWLLGFMLVGFAVTLAFLLAAVAHGH